MLFNSYGFVFLFFPLCLAGYSLCRYAGERFRDGVYESSMGKIFLLAASLIFYGWSHPGYLPVLICSMAVNYGLFWQMEKAVNRKMVLTAGLMINLGALACFKYVGTGEFVPLGISFFTFTQIAFLVECYRGNLKEVSALSYGLYVSFFPKMIQGPIALPDEILPQLQKAGNKADWEQVYRNLYLFVLGLFKKVLIADTLGKAADFGYANLGALNSGDGLIVMLAYTLQLYFDFSGYCDMAMGAAGMLGICLPVNFASPYKAANILEFWKGWHITLTGFFTRYLYIPLGGSRKGRARTYLNCLIIFFVSGIWHGVGVQFIIWGLMHGILYVLTRAWKDFSGSAGRIYSGSRSEEGSRRRRGVSGLWKRVAHGGSVLLTFLYVNAAWIFFRAPSVKDAAILIKTIFRFSFGRINWNLADCFNLDEFWYVIKVFGLDRWQYGHYILTALILAAALMIVFFGKNAADFVRTAKPGVVNTIIMAVLFTWSVLSFSGVSSFLYVNF